MIEDLVLNTISGVLTVPVYMETPPDPPETYVRIEKVGESEEDFLMLSELVLQSYAPSLAEAAELSSAVRLACMELEIQPDVSGVYNGGQYNDTDTGAKNYRYKLIIDIYHY